MSAAAQSLIRAEVRRSRADRSPSLRAHDCAAMTELFLSLSETLEAHCIAAYASLVTEPDTWSIIESLHRRGTRVLLPRIAGPRTLEWGAYDGPASVQPGLWGIQEPTESAGEQLDDANVIIVPAMAVDARSGVRIGYGGGFFDTALAGIPRHTHGGPVRVTVNFDDEVREGLPDNDWDARVDVTVTPTRVLRR